VTILFQVTKTVTNQGFLSVRAPTDFRIAQACAASVQQLAFGSGLAISPLDVPLPGVLCRGQHPATNRFEVYFVSQAALLAGGVRYRLVASVWNPVRVSATEGTWTLLSYEGDSLLDVGRVASPRLAVPFARFEVELAVSSAARLPVTVHLELPE
ncbi:unnamed protein product, partial [Effrenium voratum]